jgi:hypothetical protein
MKRAAVNIDHLQRRNLELKDIIDEKESHIRSLSAAQQRVDYGISASALGVHTNMNANPVSNSSSVLPSHPVFVPAPSNTASSVAGGSTSINDNGLYLSRANISAISDHEVNNPRLMHRSRVGRARDGTYLRPGSAATIRQVPKKSHLNGHRGHNHRSIDEDGKDSADGHYYARHSHRAAATTAVDSSILSDSSADSLWAAENQNLRRRIKDLETLNFNLQKVVQVSEDIEAELQGQLNELRSQVICLIGIRTQYFKISCVII